MKHISGIMAFCGLCLTVGAAGGADTAPLMQSVLCMLTGFMLLWLAERVYSLRMRAVRKAWFRFQKNVRHRMAQKRSVRKEQIGTVLPGVFASTVYEQADS